MIPCNTQVVHRPSGAKGRVWHHDKAKGVLCIVGAGQPACFTYWKRKDLLIVDADKECPFCYGTGHNVGE